MRLDKFLVHTGYGSRKQVRQLIKHKVVSVDGQIAISASMHIDPHRQTVKVRGKQVDYQNYLYLMLNKPKNVITATVDRKETTVLDLIPEKYRQRKLAPVGRLDKDTEGLILLTNDGKINHRLTSPKANIWKTYEVIVQGKVTAEHVEIFNKGVQLDDGYITKPAKLKIIASGPQSHVELAITEGKYHQVKRMFQVLDMKVLALKRTKIGAITLDENLATGECRPLKQTELDWIKQVKRGEYNGATY